jgi:hypothetical protein
MTHYESAIDEIAGRLQGTDASLTSSIAEILAAGPATRSRKVQYQGRSDGRGGRLRVRGCPLHVRTPETLETA